MLTVDQPCNEALWTDWINESANKARCTIYVNAKRPFTLRDTEHWQMIDRPVTDTQWGTCSLVLAHQALLRHALAADSENKWFALVSGDALPLMSLDMLIERLERLPTSASCVGAMALRNDMCNLLMHAAQSLADADQSIAAQNWWTATFASQHCDSEGTFCYIEPSLVKCHGQFVLLSRQHAEWLVAMPECVARDYDCLMAPHDNLNPFAADEVVVGTYLAWQQRQREQSSASDSSTLGLLLDLDAMLAPSSLDGQHAKMHRAFGRSWEHTMWRDDCWFFARKFSPLSARSVAQLKSLWRKRELLFE